MSDLEIATKAVRDEYGSRLCFDDPARSLKRYCEIFPDRCRCREIARAVLSELAHTPPSDRNAIIEECAKVAEKAWPRAHTYASENADLYAAQDHAVQTAVKAIRALAAPSASQEGE